MNNQHIIILKNYKNLPTYLSILGEKEVFVNGLFLNVKEITLALEKSSKRHFTTSYPIKNIEYEIVGTIEEYYKENKILLEHIELWLSKNHLSLSWLQKLQINEINKNDNNLEKNLIILEKTYNKIFPTNQTMSFLDF